MRNETISSNIPNTPVRFHAPSQKRMIGNVSSPHIHNEIEILYVKSGVFTAYNDSVSISAKSGDVIFINSRTVHSTECAADGTSAGMIQFDVSELSQNHLQNISKYFRRFLAGDEYPMYLFKAENPETQELNRYIDEINSELERKDTAYEMYIHSTIYRILAFLHRCKIIHDETEFFSSKTVERILPALNYIDINYQKEITLESVSETLNLNPNYFCRLFKSATNSTFTEYLNFVRICKAEKMIVSGKDTISEIASLVGFSSVSYFNRIFKRYKGCTPSAYHKVKYAIG